MTTRTRATVAAGFLAAGILVGAAGTIAARDATATDFADKMHMTAAAGSRGSMAEMMPVMGDGQMAEMMSMMGDGQMAEMMSMMGDGQMAETMAMMGDGQMAEMMSMMSGMGGAGSSMMPNASMAPDASTSPEDHLKHHASPSPAATR